MNNRALLEAVRNVREAQEIISPEHSEDLLIEIINGLHHLTPKLSRLIRGTLVDQLREDLERGKYHRQLIDIAVQLDTIHTEAFTPEEDDGGYQEYGPDEDE